jgi:hypothetical protein
VEGLKPGILLEVGFDTVTPNEKLSIGLQTIVRKFRREQETGEGNPNYMRQYYDVSRLLLREDVQAFIGTKEYQDHKAERIRGKDKEIPLAENEAFLLSDPELRKSFALRYAKTANLYYKGQPPFDDLLAIIHGNLHKV